MSRALAQVAATAGRAALRPRGQLAAALAWGVAHAWLPTGLAVLWLAYLLVWQRGPYLDDYNLRGDALDPVTGEWLPFWLRLLERRPRALALTLGPALAALLESQELLVRTLLAAVVGANALLLGLLVDRVVGARLPAVVAGWLFLVPLPAQEALLWVGALNYPAAALAGLAVLHSGLSLPGSRRPGLWVGLSTLGLLATLELNEYPVAAVGLIPVLVWLRAGRRGEAPRLGATLALVAWLAVVALTLYLAVYRGSVLLVDRGGLDLSPAGIAARSVRYSWDLQQVTGPPGQQLAAEALQGGLALLASTRRGQALAGLAALGILASALAYRPERDAGPAGARAAALLLLICALAAGPALLFPSILLVGQWPVPRLYYFPAALLAVALGALAWLVVRRLGRLGAGAALLLAGALTLASGVALLGLAGAYASRSQLDRQQVAALVAAVPPAHLPTPAHLVVLHADASFLRLPGRGDRLNATLWSGLEAEWSAQAIVEAAYRRTDVSVVTHNRWSRLGLAAGRAAAGGPVRTLRVGSGAEPGGVELPVERTVVVVFLAGRAQAVESLLLRAPRGEPREAVTFPVASRLRQAGVPTLASFEAP